MLKHRVMTAIIGGGLLVLLFIYGAPSLIAFALGAGLFLSVFEATSMLIPACIETFTREPEEKKYLLSKTKHFNYFNICMGLSLFVTMLGSQNVNASIVIFAGLVISWVAALFLAASPAAIMGLVFANTFSLLYGSVFWFIIWELFSMPGSFYNVFFLLLIVFASDTGAYFSGRFFGKRKLAPHLSPKKTVEGLIGGVLSGIVVVCLYNFLLDELFSSSYLYIVLAGLIASLIGVLGDLFESTLKRFANVKDSGGLLPGHGGILDRIDALIFAAPLVWYMLTIMGDKG